MEVGFPHLTGSGKMLIPVVSGKACIYIVIPRADTKKTILSKILKNTKITSRWNL